MSAFTISFRVLLRTLSFVCSVGVIIWVSDSCVTPINTSRYSMTVSLYIIFIEISFSFFRLSSSLIFSIIGSFAFFPNRDRRRLLIERNLLLLTRRNEDQGSTENCYVYYLFHDDTISNIRQLYQISKSSKGILIKTYVPLIEPFTSFISSGPSKLISFLEIFLINSIRFEVISIPCDR